MEIKKFRSIEETKKELDQIDESIITEHGKINAMTKLQVISKINTKETIKALQKYKEDILNNIFYISSFKTNEIIPFLSIALTMVNNKTYNNTLIYFNQERFNLIAPTENIIKLKRLEDKQETFNLNNPEMLRNYLINLLNNDKFILIEDYRPFFNLYDEEKMSLPTELEKFPELEETIIGFLDKRLLGDLTDEIDIENYINGMKKENKKSRRIQC